MPCDRLQPSHRPSANLLTLVPKVVVPWRGTISGLGTETSAEVVSHEASRVAWLWLWMPYGPGDPETVSGEPQFCLWRNSGSSALIGRARPWGTPSYTPSLTPHRENRFSPQGRACSFPSWPEAPTGWGAGAPGPCDHTTFLPVTGQGNSLQPSWWHGETRRTRRGGPCTAMPDPRMQTVGMVWGRIETWK